MSFTPEQITEILQIYFDNFVSQTYTGMRYVPIFGRKGESTIAWDNSEPYEPLTIVTYNNESYTSRQYVPAGVAITNTDYWAKTGAINAQIAELQDALPIAQFDSENTVKAYIDEIADLLPSSAFDSVNTVRGAINTLDGRVDNLETLISNKEFDTVSDMASDNNLSVGTICHTNGFHSIGDGGAAYYEIKNTGTANAMDVIACQNSLLAHLIVQGERNVKQYGAYGDNTHDDSAVMAYVFSFLDTEDLTMYIPKGTYIVNPKSMASSSGGYSCNIFGDGRTSKLFIPNGSCDSDYSTMFNFTGVSRGMICIHDLFIDMNQTNNQEPSAYAWQHSSAIYMYPGNDAQYNCHIYNMYFNDLIADGILCGGNTARTFGNILIENIISTNKAGIRSDICLTGCWNNATITNCIVCRLETEVNAYSASFDCDLSISNCIITDQLDLDQKNSSPVKYPTNKCSNVQISNCVIKDVYQINNGRYHFDNCTFAPTHSIRLASSDVYFNACKVFVDGDGYTNATVFYSESNGTESSIHFYNSDIVLNVAVSTALISFVGDTGSATWNQQIEMIGCNIVTVSHLINFRTGNVRFIDNTVNWTGSLDTTNYLMMCGTNNNLVNDVMAEIYNNKIIGADIYFIQPPIAGKKLTIRMNNNRTTNLGTLIHFTRYDKIDSFRGGSGSNVRIEEIDDLVSDATPTTGRYVKGQKVWNSNPSSGNPVCWVAMANAAVGSANFTAIITMA